MISAFRAVLLQTRLALAALLLSFFVAAPAAAQVPADLRTFDEISPMAPLPIDGVWRLQELNRQVLIENGHVIAMEEWNHMFLWTVQRGMVTSTDLRQTGPSSFSAYDALLKRTMQWTVREDGIIVASGGNGLLDPKFTLSPIELAYPAAFEELRAGRYDPAPELPGPLPPPAVQPAPMPVPLPGPPPGLAVEPQRPEPLDLDINITGPIQNGAGKCLDLHGPDAAKQGGKVQVWNCLGGANQRFLYLEDDGLILTASGMCLEAAGSGDGAAVQTFGCDGNSAQLWTVVRVPLVGAVIRHDATMKCLDADAAGASNNGGVVQLWECNMAPHQQWSVE